MWKKICLLLLAIILVVSVGFAACDTDKNKTYKEDRETQEEIMEKAKAAVPIYMTQNFLTREAINEYMKRTDVPDKLWYIYVMTDSGAFVGYYISRTIPVSIGVAMSNPSQIVDRDNADCVVPAPGVDGVYWNGADPSLYYFFEASTDVMVQCTFDFLCLDAPMDVDAPQLHVVVE